MASPSLMGKLMARSMRKEKVQVLQLFRHLVQQGFTPPRSVSDGGTDDVKIQARGASHSFGTAGR